MVTKAADAGWEKAASIWEKLHPKVEESPAAQIAIKDVAAEPDASAFHAVLARRIAEMLEVDPGLRAELSKLLPAPAQANTAIAWGPGSVAIGGNTNKTTITTGGQAASRAAQHADE